jgi:formylglycine-generating enzyme required for sulfatase activity
VIERDQGSGYAEIASIDANQTAYTDNTLTYSETYQYRVKAKTDLNSSAYTNESLPVEVIISPPYNLSYSKIDEFSLELTWNDTCHFENGFKIERDDGSGFTEIATVNADQHSYTDNDVVIDVDYEYRVYTFTTKNQSVKTENMHVVLPPDGFSFVRGNTFQMGDIWHIGDEDEFPIRFVTLPDFYMGKYEVTHADFIEFLNSVEVDEDGYKDGNMLIDIRDIDCAVEWDGMEFFFNKTSKVSTINSAVIEVTWYGAVEYCNWLSEINGKQTAYTIDGENVICDWEVLGYRLPTEAEWEFAARAGGRDDQKYSGTNYDSEANDYVVNYQNSGGRVNDVGTKLPNPLGIYDMSGNVWEWCWDWHAGYLSTNPYFPTGPADGDYKVRRGGSWSYGIYYSRTSNRGSNSPTISNDFIGFRVCLPRE